MSGGAELKAQVLDSAVCSLCGACLDWCPYLKIMEDHLVVPFDCQKEEGRCCKVCPRTCTDWKEVRSKFTEGEDSPELGTYMSLYRVKAVTPVNGQQDGGTVTTLLQTALENGVAQAALITGNTDEIIPQPLIGGLEEIKQSAGSRFLASPGMRRIMEARKKNLESLVVVGRPCQIQAVRKMQTNLPEEVPEILTIGLFCMWSLSWDFKNFLQKEFPGKEIKGISIPRHAVQVHTDSGTYELPTSTVKNYVSPGCSYCLDMTSELADLSVGAFESESGWNTLIVRSQAGQKLLDQARQKGALLIEPYPESELSGLETASFNKKARNLSHIQQGVQERKIAAFIDTSQPEYQALRAKNEGRVNQ